MRLIIIFLLLLCKYNLEAQNCCHKLLEQGKVLCANGNKKDAKLKWDVAKTCDDATSYDIQTLNDLIANIGNCGEQKDIFDMVYVEGGTFSMGTNDYDWAKPVHSVTVNDFYIGKFEVTQTQWREIMGSDPPELIKGCDKCPVERVSWNDVQEFLKKLNARTGKKYRLPTEAEWEFAARGGNKSNGYTYSGSNTLENVAWFDKNSNSKIHGTGGLQDNELGIFDMSGNVWEWCNDWYKADYYKNSPKQNPQGSSSGDSRVVRGGSWSGNSLNCRVANRLLSAPTYRFGSIGFRVARYK